MTTTCTYLQQLTQVSDVAHGPLVVGLFPEGKTSIIPKFHRSDLVILVILEGGKPCLITE